MSERQEKKRRYNLRLEYIAHFADWLDREPPMWMFWRWKKWKASRPVWDNSKETFDFTGYFGRNGQ